MTDPFLGNPQNTIAVLQKYHFNFQKKFGQNFFDRYPRSGQDYTRS